MAENWSVVCIDDVAVSFVCAPAVDSPRPAKTINAPATRVLYMRHLTCRVKLHPRWTFLQGWLHFPVPLPDGINRWINHKFHQERSDDATHHRRSDSLHH